MPLPWFLFGPRGLEGRGVLLPAPQLFSADGGRGSLLLLGGYPAVTEPDGGAGGATIDPGGAGSPGSPRVTVQPG